MCALDTYKSKRRFKKTPEPEPDKSIKTRSSVFVIQKHNASHLHYDFRIEHNGVLKSWSIPKGPSLDPKDKRLAVMTEDHPYEYKDFEGVIPPGNYGAGAVMIWDNGSFRAINAKNEKENKQEIEKGLEKGHLSLVLNGEKLCGEFALVRLKRGSEKDWLMIKKQDDYASEKPVPNENLSTKTGRTMEEIAESPTDIWKSEVNKILEEVPITAMPHKIKPMLSMLYNKPFSDKDWIFEIKWDGYRAICEIEKGKISLYSRNLKSFNERFPQIITSLKQIQHDIILDGEIVVLDKNGKPNFGWLQDFDKKQAGQIYYYVFDLLYIDGKNIQNLSLLERKMILRYILSQNISNIRYCDHVSGEEGESFFELIKTNKLEGVMAKKTESTYLSGIRSMNWLKIKNKLSQEVVIGGYQVSGRRELSSLLLGVNTKEGLQYIGNVGTGFSEKDIKILLQALVHIKTSKSPFCNYKDAMTGQFWIKPEMVCEITFTEWTNDKKLRHPVYLGLREDIDPDEVTLEIPINDKKS